MTGLCLSKANWTNISKDTGTSVRYYRNPSTSQPWKDSSRAAHPDRHNNWSTEYPPNSLTETRPPVRYIKTGNYRRLTKDGRSIPCTPSDRNTEVTLRNNQFHSSNDQWAPDDLFPGLKNQHNRLDTKFRPVPTTDSNQTDQGDNSLHVLRTREGSSFAGSPIGQKTTNLATKLLSR